MPEQKDSREAGPQMRPKPGTPTTSIINAEKQSIAWDLIEEAARKIGVSAAAREYKVSIGAVTSRKIRCGWKGIPDARSLAKTGNTGSEIVVAEAGDFSSRIAPYREKVFRKMDDSLGKFRAKAPKSFKEFDSASKIAERMLGIGDESAKVGVLVHINEMIDAHGESMEPIEAREISTVTLRPSLPESEQQGTSDTAQTESDALKESAP